MFLSKRFASVLVLTSLCFVLAASAADTTPTIAATDTLPLFAVQIRTGAKWDSAKPPQEQAHFREHSVNLKRLRDAGHLVMGARYSDVGLIILAAESEAQARAMMDEDPSFAAETFRYEVHPFNVFYPGTLQARKRP